MDTFPLYNLMSFLGMRYVIAILGFAAILSVVLECIASGDGFSPKTIIINTVVFGTMLFLAVFIIYITYRLFLGDQFHFFALTLSAFIIFLLVSVAIIASNVLSDSSEFHIAQVFLSSAASLAIAAIFSAFVVVARRFMSP